MLGTGTNADPMRSRFPTAIHFQRDPVAMTMIVDIPDDDLPPAILAALQAQATVTPDGPILTNVTAAQRTAIIAALKLRYPTSPNLDNVDVK